MSGATQVTINLNILGTFGGAPFPGTFTIDGTDFPITFTPVSGTSTTSVVISTTISPGSHTFTLSIISAGNNMTFQLVFDDVPPTISPIVPLVFIANRLTGTVILSIHCLHGSSLISTKDGLKRIDKLIPGDEVFSGINLDEHVKIKEIVQCWITIPEPEHDAIIFEPNSLDDNEPLQRLIIDPGHPICVRKKFIEKGFAALKTADHI